MSRFTSFLKSLLEMLVRGAVGFVAGIVIAGLALLFLGVLHGHRDLNAVQLEQERRAWWLVLYLACGVAALAVIFGKLSVPRFWLWFFVAFGVICIIPFWPFKDGSLLPFGTPYVNSGFHMVEAVMLAIHVAVSLAIAATIYWGRPRLLRRKKAG